MSGSIRVQNLKRMTYSLVCSRRTPRALSGGSQGSEWMCLRRRDRGRCWWSLQSCGAWWAVHRSRSFFLLTQLWQKLHWKELDNLPEIWQGCHRITQHPLHNYSIITDPGDSMKCACERGYPPFQVLFLSRHKPRTRWKNTHGIAFHEKMGGKILVQND